MVKTEVTANYQGERKAYGQQAAEFTPRLAM